MTRAIKHHLTEPLLMGYAAGTLPEAFSLVVASHASLCDDCRAALAAYEEVGGHIIDDGGEIPVSDDALAATMARIGDVSPDPRPDASEPGVFPAPLRDYVRGDVDAVRWRRIAGGVSQMILPTAKGATVRLLHIPAGAEMPDHGHRGTELTLVLQGAFEDEDGRFDVGDVEVANQDVKHTPVAVGDVDCICLAATDAPLSFDGVLPKIAQRIFRI